MLAWLLLYVLAAAVLAVARRAPSSSDGESAPARQAARHDHAHGLADADGRAPAPAADPAAGPGLAVGVTEFNPNLSPPDTRAAAGAVGRGARRARRDPARVLPARDRLGLDPAGRRAARRPRQARDAAACARSGRAWAGSACATSCGRSRSRQREGGWQTLVVLDRHAGLGGRPAVGLRAAEHAAPRARPPRADALPAYRQLILDVLKAADEEGATLRFWSPWNEPNHPAVHQPAARGVRPGRRRASRPAVYAELARTMISALDEAPGDQQLVLGETAGLLKSDAGSRPSVPEFIDGPAAGRRVRLDRLDPARLHRRRRPGRAGRRRARRPRLPAAAHDLDHRDRRRPGAEGPLRRRAIPTAAGCRASTTGSCSGSTTRA